MPDFPKNDVEMTTLAADAAALKTLVKDISALISGKIKDAQKTIETSAKGLTKPVAKIDAIVQAFDAGKVPANKTEAMLAEALAARKLIQDIAHTAKAKLDAVKTETAKVDYAGFHTDTADRIARDTASANPKYADMSKAKQDEAEYKIYSAIEERVEAAHAAFDKIFDDVYKMTGKLDPLVDAIQRADLAASAKAKSVQAKAGRFAQDKSKYADKANALLTKLQDSIATSGRLMLTLANTDAKKRQKLKTEVVTQFDGWISSGKAFCDLMTAAQGDKVAQTVILDCKKKFEAFEKEIRKFLDSMSRVMKDYPTEVAEMHRSKPKLAGMLAEMTKAVS